MHRVIPIADKSGKIISYNLKPLMLEFKPKDIMQVVIGCALLAIPVSLTEEAWDLGDTLPLTNVGLIATLSLTLIAIFVYFNYYRANINGYFLEFVKRVIGTYLISLAVVAVLLTLIEKCPWQHDIILAWKRIIIVAFPSAMSGTLTDTIR